MRGQRLTGAPTFCTVIGLTSLEGKGRGGSEHRRIGRGKVQRQEWKDKIKGHEREWVEQDYKMKNTTKGAWKEAINTAANERKKLG